MISILHFYPYFQNKTLQNNSKPRRRKKKKKKKECKEELAWCNHTVEYWILPANFKLIFLKRDKGQTLSSQSLHKNCHLAGTAVWLASLKEDTVWSQQSCSLLASRHNPRLICTALDLHSTHHLSPAYGSGLGTCRESEYLALAMIRMKDTNP